MSTVNRSSNQAASQVRSFRGEAFDPAIDWEQVLERADLRILTGLLEALRRRMKGRYDRHVPLGTLLHDRWQLARDYGFGEGTSVYEECLILGNVQVGKHCWIGPFTVLDGQGGLVIGDYVDVGAGAHLYTQNTAERALTGHQAPLHRQATQIGNCCVIAPHAIIGPGSTIGDHSLVAPGSYVEGNFPPHSYLAGNPAKRVGTVTLKGAQARLQRTDRELLRDGEAQ